MTVCAPVVLFVPRSQNAIARPASAMMVAMTGTQGEVLQLSAKYQSPKRSRNGTTIAAAVHSCVRMAGGICDCPKTANATMAANSRRRMNQSRFAPAPAQMSFRIFCVVANTELVAVVVPFATTVPVAGLLTGDGAGASGGFGLGAVVLTGGLTGVGAGTGLGGGAVSESSPLGVTFVAMVVIQTG